MRDDAWVWLPLSDEDRAAVAILRAAQYAPRLDDEEHEFLDRVARAGTYTPAQRDWLDRIWDRVIG